MAKNNASRSGFPARPRSIPREDVALARWLLGKGISIDLAPGAMADVILRGEAMLVGIGRVRPLELSTVANLLSVDADVLRKALASSQSVT